MIVQNLQATKEKYKEAVQQYQQTEKLFFDWTNANLPLHEYREVWDNPIKYEAERLKEVERLHNESLKYEKSSK